ncbi:MAG: alpha/beta fold hydrolase, partial [Pseudomonadota bacterium]|nr:alpha/beta fold hydrolase [Pseudomonadota bacterium]
MVGTTEAARLKPGLWLNIGIALIIIGVVLAALVERAGGITVSDVRFKGADGTTFSALVYRPATATTEHPAPGILAVHGYINTRETQSPFAIELARRGYVVVALDQRGHGYSGGAATAKGFGGPEGLTYLRSLPFVDKDNIGLEGHSMGGWTVLAAAAVMPDAYKAIVLEGSSTGAPFAKEGTASWPRNLAVVYSRFDEFAPLMWQAPRAVDVGATPKLKALFGADATVEPGKTYGDIAAGTARRLTQPVATHPGDHLSTHAVADAADWFALTLKGGTPRARTDQIWWAKEIGTGLGLLGIGALMLGLFDLLLGIPLFAGLRGTPQPTAQARSGKWWTLWALTAFVPAVTFYLLPGFTVFKPSALFPQSITNALMVWALVNVVLALLFGMWLGAKGSKGPAPWALSALMAVVVVGVLYGVTALAGLVQVDFRFWVVALKPLDARQAVATLSYIIPFTLFVAVAFRGLAGLATSGGRGHYGWAAGALATGFLVLTGGQYL